MLLLVREQDDEEDAGGRKKGGLEVGGQIQVRGERKCFSQEGDGQLLEEGTA